jgi:hypothetical protein
MLLLLLLMIVLMCDEGEDGIMNDGDVVDGINDDRVDDA